MRRFGICRTLICAAALLALAACRSAPATSCAGFREVALSPAGVVALIQADRPAAERIEGNDATGRRLGCW